MAATALEELPDWARDLLEAARVGRLGFVDDRDRPRVLPVTYAVAGERLYTAIDEKPKRGGEVARVRYLRRRPEAALCVDRYSDDWNRLAWVQVLGTVELVPVAEDARGLQALCAKYEPYRSSPPPGPLLRLRCDRVVHWRGED